MTDTGTSRLGMQAVVTCLFSLMLLSSPLAAQEAKKADKADIPAPSNETLQADSALVHITYYKSTMGREAPVVVLLHMKDGNRFVWQNGFAEQLQREGYAVITVDLRGHGESRLGPAAISGGNANQDPADKKKKSGSKKPTGKQPAENELKPAQYQAMVVEDMEAVKRFIFEEHEAGNLNMNKLGIIGPEMGASVAVNFALRDWEKTPHPDAPEGFRTPRGQDVRALVLISPQSNFESLNTMKPLAALRAPAWNIAFLVAVGKKDPKDRGQAKKIYDQLSSFPKSEERMYFDEYSASVRGTDLLGKTPKFEEHILVFLKKHLMEAQSMWRERRSKLEKKKT